MIKNLILDIGNVICEWNPERLCASVTDNVSDHQEVLDVTIKHADWLELDKGTLSVAQATANAQTRTELDSSVIAGVYQNLPESLQIIESTVVAMNRAANAGVPMYILSNMQSHAWDYLEKTHACFGLCAGVVVSCDVGLIKPDPKIYQHLCERFSLQASECIFIDDMLENIEAARDCGWHAEQMVSIADSEAVLNGVLDRIVTQCSEFFQTSASRLFAQKVYFQ